MTFFVKFNALSHFVKENPGYTFCIIMSLIAIVALLIINKYSAKNTPAGDFTPPAGIVDNIEDKLNMKITKKLEATINQYLKTKDRQLKNEIQNLMPGDLLVYQQNEYHNPVRKERDVFLESLEVISASKSIVIDSAKFNNDHEPILLIVKIH